MKIQKSDVFLDLSKFWWKIVDDQLKNPDNDFKELSKEEKKVIKKEVKEILKKQDNINRDNWIKAELTKEEKVSNFFNKIKFLSLDDVKKEEVALKVKTDAEWDKLYWIEIFLSSWIAALWLLQNSVAVVIWAMLIAPLLRPINGLSFSIARWVHTFFIKSFKVLLFSVISSIFMWYIVSRVIWLNIETTEILSRITPNVIDFFIAFFSGIVAVLSLRFVRLWESIAWVAMAASLMPPLAVVWIEIYMNNYSSAFSAFTLFWANLIAILFVWTMFFWLYWFTPHNIQKQTKVFKRLFVVLLIWFIILIPLLISFNKIKTDFNISNVVKIHFEQILKTEISDFYVTDVKVINNSKDVLFLKVDLKLPENKDVSTTIEVIAKALTKIYNKEVDFDIEITRILRIHEKNK